MTTSNTMPERHARETKPRGRRLSTGARAVVIGLLAGGALWFVLTAIRIYRAAFAVRDGLTALEELAADPQSVDLVRAAETVHSLREHIEDVERASRPFVWLTPWLGWVPGYGADIQAAPQLLAIACDAAVAGDDALQALSPLLRHVDGAGGSSDGTLLPVASNTLVAAQAELQEAWTTIGQARAAREEFAWNTITADRGLSPHVAGLLGQLDRGLLILEQGIGAALVASTELSALGGTGSRTYMLLVQNADELRATGGFISGVALVTVDRSGIVGVQFEDSYAVDDYTRAYPDPPAALREAMGADLWLFRDANWSPDFPTAAQAAVDLYHVSRDAQIDGVIALDQEAVRLMVGALGSLQVAGYPDAITGDSVIEAAHQSWAPGAQPEADWWEHRKDFFGALLQSSQQRLMQGLTRQELLGLGGAVRQGLNGKNVLMSMHDPASAAIIHHLGWDGALIDSRGDYLMVVSSNVGFNKANALVEQAIDCTVDLSDPANPRSALAVRLRHPGPGERPCAQQSRYDATYEQMVQRCYWDYLRIYASGGAELISATQHPIPGSELLSGLPNSGEATVGPPELGREVFANFLLVRPGESVEARFDVRLPSSVVQPGADGFTYVLLVQKQPGTSAVPLDLVVQLPQSAHVVRSIPEPSSANGSELRYAVSLERDFKLVVIVADVTG